MNQSVPSLDERAVEQVAGVAVSDEQVIEGRPPALAILPSVSMFTPPADFRRCPCRGSCGASRFVRERGRLPAHGPRLQRHAVTRLRHATIPVGYFEANSMAKVI